VADKKIRLGEMLINAGVIHEFQLNSALSFQRQLGGRLGTSLIRLGYLDEEKLLQFLADQFSLSRIDLDAQTISPEIISLIPAAKALEYSLIPFALKAIKGVEHLYVATSDPTNISAFDEVKFITGHPVHPVIASEDKIISAIKRCYDLSSTRLATKATPSSKSAEKVTQIRQAPNDSAKSLSTEEKLKILVKILIEKKILTKEDLERFKV
jgi:type IV pilus assembly protein PilB